MQRDQLLPTIRRAPGFWLALAALGLAAPLFAQDSPRPLPSPAVPVTPLPPLGPPAGTAGPQPLPLSTIETLPPGTPRGGEAIEPLPGSPLGDMLQEGVLSEEDLLFQPPQKLSPYKSGFFQKLSFSAAWFGNANDPDDLGGTEIEAFLTVALPAPIKEWPLLITPTYNMTLIDGPTVTDFPNRLYFTYVDFMWLPTIVNRWTALLSLAPSIYGDFDTGEFRFTGKALAIYDWDPGRLQ